MAQVMCYKGIILWFECALIPIINPRLILNQHLNQHLINMSIYTLSIPDWHLGQQSDNSQLLFANARSRVSWHSANYWKTVDWLLMEMLIEHQSSVTWVLIEMSVECRLRCQLQVNQGYRSRVSINAQPWMPCGSSWCCEDQDFSQPVLTWHYHMNWPFTERLIHIIRSHIIVTTETSSTKIML